MKIRKGFVSNSSSSSFVCDITSEIESGYDMCLSDANMYECENGHIFYRDYMANEEEWLKIKNHYDKTDELPDYIDEDQIYGYEIPERFCPICTFDHIKDGDAIKYIHKKYGITMDVIKKSITDNYTSYKDFTKSMESIV